MYLFYCNCTGTVNVSLTCNNNVKEIWFQWASENLRKLTVVASELAEVETAVAVIMSLCQPCGATEGWRLSNWGNVFGFSHLLDEKSGPYQCFGAPHSAKLVVVFSMNQATALLSEAPSNATQRRASNQLLPQVTPLLRCGVCNWLRVSCDRSR